MWGEHLSFKTVTSDGNDVVISSGAQKTSVTRGRPGGPSQSLSEQEVEANATLMGSDSVERMQSPLIFKMTEKWRVCSRL